MWNFEAEQKGALIRYIFQQTFVTSNLHGIRITTPLNKDVRVHSVNITDNIPDDFVGTYTFTLIAFPDTNSPGTTSSSNPASPVKTNERTVLPISTIAYTTGKWVITSKQVQHVQQKGTLGHLATEAFAQLHTQKWRRSQFCQNFVLEKRAF